jgi:thiosulfate dehydrogenase [quinone] large subunit
MRTQSILGRVSAGTHEASFGVAYLALRFCAGFLFLSAGWAKIGTSWSAATYLAVANGPFSDWFRSLAGNGFVDGLNAWGLFLLGVALLLGFGVRPAAILGMVLMTLYYLAHFVQNTANGFVDEHVLLFALLGLFAAGGAGHAFGINAVILGNLRKPGVITKFLFG